MLIKASVAAAVVSVAAMALPAVAVADASDDYPIPNRILKTTCTVDQYMAAGSSRDPSSLGRTSWTAPLQQGLGDSDFLTKPHHTGLLS